MNQRNVSIQTIVYLLFLAPHLVCSDVNVEHDLEQKITKPSQQPSAMKAIDILQDILTEATSPFIDTSTTTEVSSAITVKSKTKWRRRIRKSLAQFVSVLQSTTGIAAMALSATLTSAAIAAATVEQEVRSSAMETCPVVSDVPTMSPPKIFNAETKNIRFDVIEMSIDAETIQGAKLIAASFGLVGNTFGLIADSIRISGDTVAGVVGSTVKVVGSAVKSLSTSFDAAGSIIEPNEAHRGRKRLTSERLLYRKEQKLAGGHDEHFERKQNGFLLNSRHVASKGMKLMGNVVRGLGDSIVLVGAATESLASSTVGLAEDSVRIFEDIAGSIAAALKPKDPNRPIKVKPKENKITHDDATITQATHSFLSFGSNENIFQEDESPFGPTVDNTNGNVVDILNHYQLHVIEFFIFVLSEINGIPSLAPEIFAILGICYVACLYWISRAKYERRIKAYIHVPRLPAPSQRRDIPLHAQKLNLLRMTSVILASTYRAFLFLLVFVYRFIFDQRTALLILFLFAWAYLSWASQIRSLAIQRHAEGRGFRSAIAAIGTTVPSRSEPVLWLNTLLSQIWQIRGPEGRNPRSGRAHPSFVNKAMNSKKFDNDTCRDCANSGGECREECYVVYGGLEPTLAGVIGNSLTEVFHASKVSGPKDVAYVSMHSVTLGRQPPLIRTVKLLGKEQGGIRYEYELDVQVLFEDMEIILDVKLSSLDYALLPSTQISAHSFEANLPLKVKVASIPEYPFISVLEFSLSESPECHIRITPLSDDSGLRGIDLGSLPVIREWIQRAIQDTLSDYVAPKFVSFDYAAWMTSVPETGLSTRTDISHLRHKMQLPLNQQSSASNRLKTRSAADTMHPRHLAGPTAFVHEKYMASSLIRPNTELSKLGMDRWLAKMDVPTNLHEPQIAPESEPTRPLPRLLAQPLALLSPVLFAVAAAVFQSSKGEKSDKFETGVPLDR